jgi:hypothetical protein
LSATQPCFGHCDFSELDNLARIKELAVLTDPTKFDQPIFTVSHTLYKFGVFTLWIFIWRKVGQIFCAEILACSDFPYLLIFIYRFWQKIQQFSKLTDLI